MVSNLKWIFLLLAINLFIFSCTKHHNSSGPPQPVLFDTLGEGWQRIKIDTTIDFQDIFFVNARQAFYAATSTLGGLMMVGSPGNGCYLTH